MPELPEVETVARSLEPLVTGRTFTAVALDWPGCDASAPHSLPDALPGARCLGTGRRGKYLLLHLDLGRCLVIHLRMTGNLAVEVAGAPPLRFQRAALDMDDGRSLRFADQRKFGRLAFAADPDALKRILARVGPEPGLHGEATDFDAAYLARALAGRAAPVKAVLLDQAVVAGLGNIYVDEALFLAGVHPATPARLVGPGRIPCVVQAIRTVLEEAVANRGTTLADYRDATGVPGEHRDRLQVFRRHGKPCYRCGATIVRSVVAQRGTHACLTCQPAPLAAQ